MDAEGKLRKMEPSALVEGARLGAASIIHGVLMEDEMRILYGMVILELADRYELSVVRESN